MKNIKALLWDVDGVFVDTERLHFLAWQKLAITHGSSLTLEEYAPMIGRGSKENMEALCAMRHIAGDKDALNKERRGYYEAMRKEGIPVLEENIALAKEFKNQFPELLHAAVSSSSQKDIRENLGAAGLGNFFARTISYEDKPGLARKPAPDLYLYALEALGFSAVECLAFEDSANGVASARAAGVRCVALPNELTKDSNFSAADFVVPWGTPKAVAGIVARL
jgi:beta-phosphoglucomutase-like phosphatase (HAD superfamily)